ncbi:hypothetical protein PRIPAC_78785 [Pristionchus pacificus]|uniref:Uncharacterized protein n=1 Tax=Pristionchus pacificus TaxID=54126 RepID=A0A2A6C4Q3_PRIPA|nr:hypothetical protein PRIPAC_78785 [Pristionchus pacificus]|eukprot:PDM73033.1 hypothetical protein PRIPAC_39467 [Pristionchus pacificus]
MWNLPVWLSYTEFILTSIAILWVIFMLFIIATSQLHNVCRALFCTNVTAVLIGGVGQISIESTSFQLCSFIRPKI